MRARRLGGIAGADAGAGDQTILACLKQNRAKISKALRSRSWRATGNKDLARAQPP